MSTVIGQTLELELRIARASRILGKAIAKLAAADPEMARELGAALAAKIQTIRSVPR